MAVVMLPIDASAGLPSYTAAQTRQAFSAFLGPAPVGRPLGAISGVRAGTPSTTVFMSGGGSTTWNVAAHSGVLDTQASASAGPYAYATDGTDTGTITAANATNPRVDIVYVLVNDTVQDGSGLRSGQVLYLAGTAAPTPAPPGVPARGMVLANINVPTAGGGSPTVSWVAPTFGAQSVPWASFVPTWTGATTNPAIGNGTIDAHYTQTGKTVSWSVTITMGTTTTYGSGAWSISLPVQAAGHYPLNAVVANGALNVTTATTCALRLSAGNTAGTVVYGTGGIADATHPAAWAASQSLTLTGTYEAI